MLEQMAAHSIPSTDAFLSLFTQERDSLHWEQAYTHADSAVGGQMLANDGYAEIIGKQGPVSQHPGSRRDRGVRPRH